MYAKRLSRPVQYVQYMQGRTVRKPTISLRLPPALLEQVDALAAKAGARSRTDFIERAVEAYVEEVRESKVIVARPWTEAKARAAILRFLRGRPSAYVSDIMEALGMEPEFAFRMVDALATEGRIR